MSLVVTIRSNGFIAVACDGRSSRRQEDGSLVPTREDCHKFRVLADDLVIAGTGDSWVLDEIQREASNFVGSNASANLFAELVKFITTRLAQLHEFKKGSPGGCEGEVVALIGFDRAAGRLRNLTWVNTSQSSEAFEDSALATASGNDRATDIALELLPDVLRATRGSRLERILPALEGVVLAVAASVPSSVNSNVASHLILPGRFGPYERPRLPDLGESLDGTTFKRVLNVDADGTFHLSTPFNAQGSIPPYLGTASPFNVETSTAGSRCAAGISWLAQTIFLADRTTIQIGDSSTVAPIPPTPTGTSAVASGSLPSQGSLSVAVCYCLSGFIYGRSASKTLTVSANQVLHVPSPSDPGGMDGWIPLLASTASGGTGQGGALVPPSAPIAFGTDWQEPTSTPLVTLALSSTPPISNGATASIWNVNLSPSTSYALYPYLNPSGSLAFAGGLPATPALSSYLKMFADGSISLGKSTGIVFTTPAAGFGAAGGGGCVRKGTTIVPLGCACVGVEEPNSEWIRIRTESGRELTATPDHPVYTSESGKVPLADLRAGDLLVTDSGESKVTETTRFEEPGTRIRAVMDEGHLYWANGILSHNFKQ